MIWRKMCLGGKTEKKRLSSLTGMIKMVWGSLQNVPAASDCYELSQEYLLTMSGAVSLCWAEPRSPPLGERWELFRWLWGLGA